MEVAHEAGTTHVNAQLVADAGVAIVRMDGGGEVTVKRERERERVMSSLHSVRMPPVSFKERPIVRDDSVSMMVAFGSGTTWLNMTRKYSSPNSLDKLHLRLPSQVHRNPLDIGRLLQVEVDMSGEISRVHIASLPS